MKLESTQHELTIATVIDSNPGRRDASTADPSQIHMAKDLNLICSDTCNAAPQTKHQGKVIPSQKCKCEGVVAVNPFTNTEANQRVVFQMTEAVHIFGTPQCCNDYTTSHLHYILMNLFYTVSGAHRFCTSAHPHFCARESFLRPLQGASDLKLIRRVQLKRGEREQQS